MFHQITSAILIRSHDKAVQTTQNVKKSIKKY